MILVRRPVPLVLALLATVLSSAVLVACGGSDGPSQRPEQVLKDTFTGQKKLDSGTLDLAIDLRAKDGSTGTVRLDGPFQTNGAGTVPSFDFTLTIATGGQSLDIGFVATGGAAWVTLRGQAYKLDDATYKQFAAGYADTRTSGGASKNTSSLASFGIDPRKWLTDAKNAGTENVGGVETIHVTTGVKTAALLQDISTLLGKAGAATGEKVPESLTPAQLESAAKTLRNVKVDVFTGKKDKTLRRLVVDFDLALAPGQTVAGMTPSGMSISLGFADLNEPQTIPAPKSAKPFAALQDQIRGLLAAVGESTGSGGTSTTPDAGASASKYLDCVRRAGSDLAKVQKCAPLLQG